MPVSIGKSGSSRISTKNTINSQELGTVDSNHMEKMVEFKRQRIELPQKKKELYLLNEQLKDLKEKEDKIEIMKIEEEIQNLEQEISGIENKSNEYKYFLDTGHLLFQYYDRLNSANMSQKYSRPTVRTKSFKRGGKRTPSHHRSKSRKKTKYPPKNKPKMSRREMLDEYKSITDPNWVKKSENKNKKEESICEICQIPKVLQYKESKYICTSCGVEEITLLDSDRPSFKDPPPESNYFAYKRINHFNELLAQFQAKESTHIPKEVFDTIKKELKKERKTVKDLDYDLVKSYLKKHSNKKYNHYYDHIFHIINRLNGDKPLNMTPEMENNLRCLFQRIQIPFQKYCPADRKNFISYNFVFYKSCQLFGYKEFLKYFPLLKSKEKLYDQEKIWEKIMTDIGLPSK